MTARPVLHLVLAGVPALLGCSATSTGVTAYMLDSGGLLATNSRIQARGDVEPHQPGDAVCGAGRECEELVLELLLARQQNPRALTGSVTVGDDRTECTVSALASPSPDIFHARLVCPSGTFDPSQNAVLTILDKDFERSARVKLLPYEVWKWSAAALGSIVLVGVLGGVLLF